MARWRDAIPAAKRLVTGAGKSEVDTRNSSDVVTNAGFVGHRFQPRDIVDDITGDGTESGDLIFVTLRVRRFRCHNAAGERRTFAERWSGLIAARARRTRRLAAHGAVAVVLGGEAGARLLSRLGMATSAESGTNHVQDPQCARIPATPIVAFAHAPLPV